MPLLVKPQVVVPPPPPPPPPPPGQVVNATWTAPDGSVLPMMDRTPPGVIILQDGVAGLGAAPRTVTRQSMGTGGTFARWSHSDERLITLPIGILADDATTFLSFRREVTLAFTQTTPPAGIPRPGVLRITRADASWREISCLYLEGLAWTDAPGFGTVQDVAVLQLVAPDPWWYGPQEPALTFEAATGRNYLSPYETVSPDRTLGAATVSILGDAPASPVWTITGPANSVTVRYETAGPGWTFGAVDAGETITVDVERYTVTDNSGANRIGDLSWPTSSLFQLPPGQTDLLLSLSGGIAGQSGIRLTYRPRWETA